MMKKLSKEEMMKVMGGVRSLEVDDNDPGDCQEHGEFCSTKDHYNCCNGLVCGDNRCRHPTIV